MVNEKNNKQKTTEERLSMRYSILVWAAGAVLGWVVAVVSVWTAMNNTNGNIAGNLPTNPEQLEQIMPAAGADQTKKKPEDNN